MASTKKEIENFETPKDMSVSEIVAQEVAKAQAKLKAQLAKSSSNAIQLGAILKDLEVREGSPIKDKKSGEVIIDPNTGEVKTYANKYYATFTFMGGSITQELKPSDFGTLEINCKYFLTGYMGEVSNFGKTEILPIFNGFELLEV